MSSRVTGCVGRGNPAGAPAAGLTAESLLYAATTGSVQVLASDKLGRELTTDEIEWVAQRLTLAAGEALDTLVGSLPMASAADELHELLARHRQIAHVWSVEDVLEVRPDLDDEQAWSVLQLIDNQKDAQYGITWETLVVAAAQLYPEEGGEA